MQAPLADFFALASCTELYMASAFSSYAAMAAVLGGVPLWSLLPPNQTNLGQRYPAAVRPIPTQFAWLPAVDMDPVSRTHQRTPGRART